MAKYTDTVWRITNVDIPVRIYKEWRKTNRISINKDKVIIRTPIIAGSMPRSYESWAKEWLSQQLMDKPELASRFTIRQYRTGDLVTLPYKTYTIDIISKPKKSSSAQLYGADLIKVSLSDRLDKRQASKHTSSLLSRVIGGDLLPIVTERIQEINALYFQENIKSVRIKNNSSNWGSCSSNGNINISIRTLLAPLVVQDYVFIHELAHLKELNHSARYWSIVKAAMPEYKVHERWLKEYGGKCAI